MKLLPIILALSLVAGHVFAGGLGFNQQPIAGLVAHWTFNEGGGTTGDLSGNGWTMYSSNSAGFTSDGKILAATTNSGISTTGGFWQSLFTISSMTNTTVSAWFRCPNQDDADTSTAVRPMFQCGVSSASLGGFHCFVRRPGVANGGGLYVNTGFDTAELFVGFVTNNSWFNIIVTSGTNGLSKTYTNGVFVGTTSNYVLNATSTYRFSISGANSHNARKFRGVVDDVRVYTNSNNQEMSADEIKLIYASGNGRAQ